MKLQITRLSIVSGFILFGIIMGYFLYPHVINYLRPDGVEYVMLRPGEGTVSVAKFSILLGVWFGLLPFLTRLLKKSDSNHFLLRGILAGTGAVALVGTLLYMKSQMLSMEDMTNQLNLSTNMPIPPIGRIPFVGIVVMLTAFGVVMWLSKQQNIKNKNESEA